MNRAQLKALAKQQLGNGLFTANWMMALLFCIIVPAIISLGSIVAIGSIVLFGPMMFALNRAFLKQARDGQKMEFADLLKGFQDDFLNVFLIGLMTEIFTALWSMLFVIPGIVKAYSYSMAYYIKADNPDMKWNDCITASRNLMKGHKMDLFVLDLSFIGWMIVGSLVCGIGTLWVAPYQTATRAQFYNALVSAQNATTAA